MDESTGILTLKIGMKTAGFFLRKETHGYRDKRTLRDEALGTFIDSLDEEREVSIEYINHWKEKRSK